MEPLHIKLEYNEALQSKKDILSSQISLINIIKKINQYKKLRKQEFRQKTQIKKELKEISSKINLIENEIPEEETLEKPKIKRKTHLFKKQEKLTRVEKAKSHSIETELKEIKKKLDSLS